jgi:pteridine reductase
MGKVSEAAWDDLFSSNLKGAFFLSQAAAPFLAQAQGSIINIIDVHGERPMRDYSAYCISKAGLVMMTKSLAKELGPAVRVNAVSPGPVMAPEGENEMTEAVKQKIISRTVLKTAGSPEDVAEAVVYFACHANYVTGQILSVDGGRSLMI